MTLLRKPYRARELVRRLHPARTRRESVKAIVPAGALARALVAARRGRNPENAFESLEGQVYPHTRADGQGNIPHMMRPRSPNL